MFKDASKGTVYQLLNNSLHGVKDKDKDKDKEKLLLLETFFIFFLAY